MTIRTVLARGAGLAQMTEAEAIAKIRSAGGLGAGDCPKRQSARSELFVGTGEGDERNHRAVQFLTRLAHLNLRGAEVNDEGIALLAKQATLVAVAPRKNQGHRQGIGVAQGTGEPGVLQPVWNRDHDADWRTWKGWPN